MWGSAGANQRCLSRQQQPLQRSRWQVWASVNLQPFYFRWNKIAVLLFPCTRASKHVCHLKPSIIVMKCLKGNKHLRLRESRGQRTEVYSDTGPTAPSNGHIEIILNGSIKSFMKRKFSLHHVTRGWLDPRHNQGVFNARQEANQLNECASTQPYRGLDVLQSMTSSWLSKSTQIPRKSKHKVSHCSHWDY